MGEPIPTRTSALRLRLPLHVGQRLVEAQRAAAFTGSGLDAAQLPQMSRAVVPPAPYCQSLHAFAVSGHLLLGNLVRRCCADAGRLKDAATGWDECGAGGA